jgi:hypothetical protein
MTIGNIILMFPHDKCDEIDPLFFAFGALAQPGLHSSDTDIILLLYLPAIIPCQSNKNIDMARGGFGFDSRGRIYH